MPHYHSELSFGSPPDVRCLPLPDGSQREDMRLHLVAEHHWPTVARYKSRATTVGLVRYHVMAHDPARVHEALVLLRELIDLPDSS